MQLGKIFKMVAVGFVCVSCVVCLSSCGKKQPKQTKASTPQVSKPVAQAPDTSDVFKEFYSDDATDGKTKAKPVANKKVSKQEPVSKGSSFSGEFSETGAYTVQVSCVRSKELADAVAEKMKAKGYPAYVAEVQNPTPALSGAYYRVRIGGFAGISQAKDFGENTIVAEGSQYWVDKKSNDNVGMEGYGLGSGSSSSTSSYGTTSTPASTPSSSSSYDYGSSSSGSTPAPSTTPYSSSTSSSSSSPYSTDASPSSPTSSSTDNSAAASSTPPPAASGAGTTPEPTPATTAPAKDTTGGAGW